MGKIVLKDGLIAGLIILGVNGIAVMITGGIDMSTGEIVGWTSMPLST